MESPKKRKIFGKNGKCCLKNRQLVVESPASMPEDERERDRNFVQQALNGNAIEISVSSQERERERDLNFGQQQPQVDRCVQQ